MADNLAAIDAELKRRRRKAQAVDDELSLRSIDYTQSDDVVRSSVARLPKRLQQQARRRWAENRVKTQRKETAQTGLGAAGQVVSDTVRNLARGTVVGPYLDEWAAYASSGFDSQSPQYGEALAYERELNQAIDRDYGLVGAGTKIAGGIASAVASPIGNLFRGGTYVGNVARGGAVGAGYGATAGFGEGEGGVQNRLQSAGTGAQYGLAFGAAVPSVTGVVAPVAGRIYESIRPSTVPYTSGPSRAADLSIAQRVRQAGDGDLQTGVNRIVDDIREGQRISRMDSNSTARLPETLADRTDSLRRLTGSLYRQGGRAGEVVEETLQRRQRGPENLYDTAAQTTQLGQTGQAADMRDAFLRALRIRTSETPRQMERRLRQEARDMGNAYYGQAFANQQRFDITDILEDAQQMANDVYGQGEIGRSLLRAVGLFTRRDPEPTAVGAPAGRTTTRTPITRLEQFDAAKKNLDDMIEAAIRKGENNKARELTQLKNNLLQRIDDTNPDYGAARAQWGTNAEQREIIDRGRRALNEDSEVSAEMFNELSDAQRVLFRVGLMDAMRQANRRAKPGTDVSRPFQEQRVIELMRAAIPRSQGRNAVFADRPARFGAYVRRQGRMQQTKNIALGGSPTQRNAQDDAREAVNTVSNIWDQIRQSPSISRIVLDGVGALGQRYLGFRDDVAVVMARRLLQMNPETQIRYLQSLERRVGPDPLAGFAAGMRELAATVSREGGKAIGRNVAIEEDDG